MVRYTFPLTSFLFTNPLFQRDLHAIFECTKEFDLKIAVTDTDLSLIQECVALATQYPELSDFWTDAIAFVLGMMDARQREWFRFEQLYPDALETAIFGGGSEDDPIVVSDEEEIVVDQNVSA